MQQLTSSSTEEACLPNADILNTECDNKHRLL